MLMEPVLAPRVSVNRATHIIDMTESFLKQTKSDDELAYALGHELGHIIAEHGREQGNKLSLLGLQITPWIPVAIPGTLLMLLGAAVSPWFLPPGFLCLGIPVAPVLRNYLALSRTQEWEADYIGLLLMTDAGYDPAAASGIWEYFESYMERYTARLLLTTHLKEEDAEKTRKFVRDMIELISTHPSVSR
jgi:predicted Zn-dependent protease